MVLDFKAASSTPLSIDDYACLPRPFAVIAGRQSPPYSLAITDRIVTNLKDSELIWVDGGHFAPVTHYHQVNPLIVGILQAAENLSGAPDKIPSKLFHSASLMES